MTVDRVNQVWGLSPRVRGSQTGIPTGYQHYRSIPACAGEPSSGAFRARVSWVYPRVCGGAGRVELTHPTAAGLSPRVRGSLYAI